MALFRTRFRGPPAPTISLLPSLMVGRCLALAPDVNFLIHAFRGYLLGVVFLFLLFFTRRLYFPSKLVVRM